jgi:GT2 family glycosyltransferase
VSVVVPTYRRERVLCETLEGLLAQDHPALELLVVDQTPEHEPATRRFLEARRGRLRHLVVARPGLPHARNVGARAAQGEVVLFVDDDAPPLDRGLVAAHAACYASPLVGAVAGRLLEALPPNAPPGVARVNAFGRIVSNFSGTAPGEVCTAKGANMSFRRRVLEEVGAFDGRFAGTSLLEETDCCYRVRALGYEIRYEPRAAVRHLRAPEGGCREASWRDEAWWLFHNSALFYRAHKPRLGLPLLAGFFAARGALVVARRGGGPGDWLRLMDGLRQGARAGRRERDGTPGPAARAALELGGGGPCASASTPRW